MAGNKNHPPKHSIIKVQGIERRNDRERIERNLAGRPRDRRLFVTGCNTAFRASELTGLTVGQVRGARAGFKLVIREQKTSKIREVVLNRKVCAAIDAWLAVHPWAADDDAPLFPNLRTGRPLTVSTVSKYVKRWCRQAGLKGNYASHSMRKSFGYAMRTEHCVSLAVLTRLLGHSTERQTMCYLGIDDEELDACYLHEV
jgi:integrase